VAICLLFLLAFASFVIDYGFMWSGRGQAQTSADAGALSGAIALAFDSGTDYTGAKAKAIAIAKANTVWAQAPSVTDADVLGPWETPPGSGTAYECPPGSPGLPDTCVKVTVYRNQARNNPLPIFFGGLVGVDAQGVVATATAQILASNTTDCLKPWAVIDRWQEFGEPWSATSTFDKYSDGKGKNPPPEADVYTPPDADSPGSGFTLPEDEGRRFAVKTEGTEISSGWFREIELPRADGDWNGGNTYRNNIMTCGGLPYSIAAPDQVCPSTIGKDDAAAWAAKGCFTVKTGGTVGPTRQGIDYLINTKSGGDAGAHYVDGQGIVGSSFSPPTKSPRVVPIGVMDIDDYLSKDPSGASSAVVRLVNIYGFFIEGMGNVNADGTMTLNPGGKAVIGRLITLPSIGTSTSPVTASASFLRTVILVR
jgi:hypothetical protein